MECQKRPLTDRRTKPKVGRWTTIYGSRVTSALFVCWWHMTFRISEYVMENISDKYSPTNLLSGNIMSP